MKASFNFMRMSEAFERLRKAKALEMEAIQLMHSVEIDDLVECNFDKSQEPAAEAEDPDWAWKLRKANTPKEASAGADLMPARRSKVRLDERRKPK